jgi:hypothetical protein
MPAMMTLTKYSFLLKEGSEAVREAYGPLLDHQVEELEAILDEIHEKVKAVYADRGLNAAGVKTRLIPLANAARDEIMEVAAPKLQSDLRKAAESLPSRLPSPQGEGWSRVVAEQRHAEIRAYLRGLSDLDRETAVILAAGNGDLELLLAVQGAPACLAVVTQEELAKATRLYLETTKPEQFQAYTTVTEAIGIYTGNIKKAVTELEKMTGVPLNAGLPTAPQLDRAGQKPPVVAGVAVTV